MVDTPTYRETKRCLVCESKDLTSIFSVKSLALTGQFHKDISHMSAPIPLTMQRCTECGVLQTREIVENAEMFSNYWYRSSTTQTMREHLKRMADMYATSRGVLLDVGCNDGTFINYAIERGATFCYGIDPSNAILEARNTSQAKYIRSFFDESLLNLRDIHGRVDLITCFSVFYDFEQPSDAIKLMDSLLSPRGRAVIEVNYHKAFFERGNIDMLGHEHRVYYGIRGFKRLLEGSALRLNDVWCNDMNGGNIVFEISRLDSVTERTQKLEFEESIWEQSFDFLSFEKRQVAQFLVFTEFLKRMSNEGLDIKVLGASTRGAFVAQICGFDTSFISSAIDLQTNKVGCFLPGTNIIIEHDSNHSIPDAYVVMPYQFQSEILDRYKEFMDNGGKLIFYRPTFSVFTRSSKGLNIEAIL